MEGWKLERVKALLPLDERLCQLAEEASELAKAALKLRRAMTNVNPTPISEVEAMDNLLEECSDVLACMDTLGILDGSNDEYFRETQEWKFDRWIERLEAKKG